MQNFKGAYPLHFPKDAPTGGRRPSRVRCYDWTCDELLTFEQAKQQHNRCQTHFMDFVKRENKKYADR